MAKKTVYPGTQGRKNKVLKGPIDLTGTNKVPMVGKSPTSKWDILNMQQAAALLTKM